jgi:lipopolysaccharide biosynthesis regulator YciM
MSEKFEKLLDLLVNEEKNKAEDLFHEIVVDKSREIYEELVYNDAQHY